MNNQKLSLDEIKAKSIRGIAALTGRTFLIQIVTLISTFLLTIFLDPKEYGIFFLIGAIINFFVYFSDIGLAAALIQKKDSPNDDELKTTFSIQQLLVVTIVSLIFLLTPIFKNIFSLDTEAIYLLWALSFSLFLSSLKTIPSVLLERKLDFNKLIIPQIVETLFFYTTCVFLAWKGYGISSFTFAVLIRGFSGLILMYIIEPWMPGFKFSTVALKKLLRFGLPYQLNTFLAVFKDDGMTVILGTIIGTAGVGYLAWAQKWASAPLRFFMDQVIKVTFPAYSRLQDDIHSLSLALNRSVFFINLLIFPSLLGLVTLAPVLTQVIPKYEKWQPALLALSLLSVNTILAAITTPLTNLLNAIGKIKITFRLMIMWTVLTWIFVPALAIKFGFNGAAFGYSIVGLSSIIAIYVTSKYVAIDFWQSIIKPFIAALVMGTLIYLLQKFLPVSLLSVFIIITSGVLIYCFVIFLLVGPSIFTDIKKITRSFKIKND